MASLKSRVSGLLRFSERYTKTDLVYLTKSSFWINLNFVFVSFFSLLLSIALANLLPKEDYGIYQYILAIAAFLTAFTFTGMNAAITQSVARGHEGVLQKSIAPQFLWNMVPALLALIWSGYHLFNGDPVIAIGVALVAITLPVVATANSYLAFLAGRKEFRISALYTIAGNAFYYFCMFLAVYLVPAATPLVAVNLITSAGVAVYFYRRTIREFVPSTAPDEDAVPYARHVSAMNVLTMVATHIDKLLVFHFMGAAVLAAYGLATLLPERLAGGFKALLVAAFPRYANRDLASINSNLLRKMVLIVGVTLVCAVAYMIAAPFVLRILYPAYTEIIPYSQIYALTFVATVGHLMATALLAHKRLRELYVLNTVSPIIQIVAQVTGILTWGLWGLVIARVISAAAFGVIGFSLVRWTRR